MIIQPQMCLTQNHVEEGKLRLQAALREGKHPVVTEKRYPDGSLLRMIFDSGQLSIERISAQGEVLRRDTELIVPVTSAGAKGIHPPAGSRLTRTLTFEPYLPKS